MSVKKNNDNDKDSKSVAMNMNKEYLDNMKMKITKR